MNRNDNDSGNELFGEIPQIDIDRAGHGTENYGGYTVVKTYTREQVENLDIGNRNDVPKYNE